MKKKIKKTKTPEVIDLRIARSRELLRKALVTQLEKKTLEQIVIRDITDTARVGYATFYRHYPSKEALLTDLANKEVDRVIAMAQPKTDAADTLAACLTLCAYVDEHKLVWKTLLTRGVEGPIRKAFFNAAKELAVSRSKSDHWLPAELGITLAVSSTVELLAWWLSQPKPMPAKRAAEILNRIVIAPAVSQKS